MDYDYIIVGAGPAGLQMAYFLQKSNRRYVVFEATEKAAPFFARQPRSNRLISINKKYNYFEEDEFNLRHDWNSLLSDDQEMRFTNYSDELYPKGTDVHRYMNDFAERFQLNIKFKNRVAIVSKSSEMFTVTTENGQTHTCRCLLMATGPMEENLPEKIPGIDLCDTYDKYDMDKAKYRNKLVLILGGGNSAFETGHLLSDSAAIIHIAFPKQVKHAWNTHYVGDLRAVNNTILDMYQLKSLHTIFRQRVTKVRRNHENGKLVVTFKKSSTHWDKPSWLYYDMEYDYIISCLGWRYIKPEMFDETITIDTVKDGRFPALSSCWETTTKNLFFIGGAMAAIDRQSASGFIHGFRYNIRVLNGLLENRFFMKPLPNYELPARNLQAIAEKVMDRLTTADSLYQMQTYLCDVISIDEHGTTIVYPDMPRKHVMNVSEFKSAKNIFVMYYTYGFDRYARTTQALEVGGSNLSNNRCIGFLHTAIEYYTMGEYVDQTELQESLIVRYDKFACNNFPQWDSQLNINYVKYFINDKVKWTDEVFDLTLYPPANDSFKVVPFTEEEKARIPTQWEPAECIADKELLPAMKMEPTKDRVLRPTPDELMAITQRFA